MDNHVDNILYQAENDARSVFDVRCSIYRDAKDQYGAYIDTATNRPLRSLKLSDFLFGGFWQDEVEEYRSKLEMYARQMGYENAKAVEEVANLKKRLPAATLSGYFEQKRSKATLTRHTGFLCLDVDYQDQSNMDDYESYLEVIKSRPETACVMHSCGGRGCMVLVMLAYPDCHVQQFRALERDYRQIGISLDKSCKDVCRLRFASFDPDPFINENAVPYRGKLEENTMLQRHYGAMNFQGIEMNNQRQVELTEQLVRKIEATGTNITQANGHYNSYENWRNLCWSLISVSSTYAEDWFHRISRMDGRYQREQCQKQYKACAMQPPTRIDYRYFLKVCNDFNIRIYERRFR